MTQGNAERTEGVGAGASIAGEIFDVLLLGAGLANSFIALRLKLSNPELRVCLLEQEPASAVSHTWSFFRTDVSDQTWTWLSTLAAYHWQGYEVRFPKGSRIFATDYAALTSDGLRQAVSGVLQDDLRCGARVVEVEPTRVVLAGGEVLTAPLVIDGRGARASEVLALAWQKFVGLEVRLTAPHGLSRPVMMDATVAQQDGFRFLYLLPLGEDVLLAEDTRYSDGPSLELDALQSEILAYVDAQGWAVAEIIRRESGVLPIVLGGDIEAFWAEAAADVPQVGLRAALFHPTTGYSLPEAARLADVIAAAPQLTSAAIAPMIRARSKRLWKAQSFYRLINRLMFLTAEPLLRYRVLQRFYQLSPALIERFYAGELTRFDRARLLVGKPPVPFFQAFAAIPERAAFPRRVHDQSKSGAS
jgi:lycopene beta-cyclase